MPTGSWLKVGIQVYRNQEGILYCMSTEIAYGSIEKTRHFSSLKYLMMVDSAVYIGTLFRRNKSEHKACK